MCKLIILLIVNSFFPCGSFQQAAFVSRATIAKGRKISDLGLKKDSNANVGKETNLVLEDDTVKNRSLSCFEQIAERITDTIIQSDAKRDTGFDGASTGWTSWIDETSASQLQDTIDRIVLKNKSNDNDEWQNSNVMRWIRSCPVPLLIEYTDELRTAVQMTERYRIFFISQNNNITNEDINNNNHNDNSNNDILPRIGMRWIYLPSGSTLRQPLRTAPGAMVYGILLFGGVTRFRLIGGQSVKKKRRAGERTAIVTKTTTTNEQPTSVNKDLSWLQYGGPERSYEALDIGPCLLMEIILLPTGLELSLLNETFTSDDDDMILTSPPWNVADRLSLLEREDQNTTTSKQLAVVRSSRNDSTSFDVCDLETGFCTSIGGLRPQINEIVRRVLDGRVVRPASLDNSDVAVSHELDKIRREEMEGLLELGLQPIRGLLLYGPPGCGKTALAREISNILDARPPKILAASELLDRWVGGTEKLVRELFSDAEYELNQVCNGDATKSALHVIVVDEIDAVFRRRSAADSASEVTRASAVNQILSKLDGVQTLGNVLFIGMTNRKDLLDPALLRPGRLEVQIEIPPPDVEGRREILKIHFGALLERGRLSKPLCDAIDGINQKQAKTGFFRRLFKSPYGKIFDLATSTHGYSGADLAGLVRNAGSHALARARSEGDGTVDGLLITLDDVSKALEERTE